MNKAQRIKMMAELWPNACAFNGWKRTDDAKRYDVFARVLTGVSTPPERRAHYLMMIERHGKIGTGDISHEDDISAVFKELKQIAGKVPTYDPKKKQLLWVVRHQLRPCLALYKEQPDTAMTTILKERHKIFNGISTIEDLSAVETTRPSRQDPKRMVTTSPLKEFIFTLARVIDKLRSAAGDSGHEMCVQARVKCKCADCAKYGQQHLKRGVAESRNEVLADDHNEEVLMANHSCEFGDSGFCVHCGEPGEFAELQPVTEEEPF